MSGLGIAKGLTFIPFLRPPSSGEGQVLGLSAIAGNGTTTLLWQEQGDIDSVNIYRNDSLVDNVNAGVKTWNSGSIPDGLYTWKVVPVKGGVEGAGFQTKKFGCMSGHVWVDAVNGSDSNNGSSPQQAVKTLNKAGSLVNQAGRRVVVRGGLYQEYNSRISNSNIGNPPLTTFTQHGLSNNYCELRSFPGEQVIIDGSGIQRPQPQNEDPQVPELFTISGNYWRVEGWPSDDPSDPTKYWIEFRNSAGSGFRTRLTQGVKLRYVKSHSNEGSGFNLQTSYNGTLEDFAAWNNYSYSNDGESADGVSLGDASGWTCRYGFVAWNGDDGIDTIISTDCLVEYVVAYKNGYFMDGTPGQGNGNGFKVAHLSNPNSGNVYRNCIAAYNRVAGITINDGGGLVAQCTVLRNDGYGIVGGDHGTSTIRENISAMNRPENPTSSRQFLAGDGPPEDVQYNSWQVGATVTVDDFVTLDFDESWRSWDQVVAANFAGLVGDSDLKGMGEAGQDLGYEGTYTEPEPDPIELPEVGEAFGGGYFVGVIDTTKGNIIANDAYQQGRKYALIVSPKSLEIAVDSSRRWHSIGGVNFAAAKTRWNGLAATEAMTEASSDFRAATYVSGLPYPDDGGSQWYIPAMDELELVYRNLKPTTANNATSGYETNAFPGTEQQHGYNPSSDTPGSAYQADNPTQTSVTAFKSGGTEALPGAPLQTVMTSSWATSTTMWVQDMGDGWQFDMTQTTTSNLSIRPVRRIYLDE